MGLKRPWSLDESELKRLYLETDLTQEQIGAQIGRSYAAVRTHVMRLVAKKELPKIRPIVRQAMGVSDPLEDQIFTLLNKGKAVSVRTLSQLLDRSPDTILAVLDTMEKDGYMLTRSEGIVTIPKRPPKVPEPTWTLADEAGMVVSLGFISDIHSGCRHSQPTAVSRCAEIMYYEYNVKHFLQCGDGTTGIYVYSGQEEDLIPAARPLSKRKSRGATLNQVMLLDSYTPRLDGAIWYVLGGNHDWSHIKWNGMDPIRRLCDMREDCYYMGYDVGGLWITDKVYVRLWHPRGGMPYAKSYRLQKGLEALAMEALRQAIAEEEMPATSLLMAGHLHSSIWIPELPLPAGFPGCFQGQTNLFKQRGWYPALGGTVIRMLLTDSGKVQRVEHTFIPFEEIKEDWRSWPVPEAYYQDYEGEDLDVLFEFQPRGLDEPFVKDDPRDLANYTEYVGGK